MKFLPGGQQAEAALYCEVADEGKWVLYEDYAKVKEAGQNILQHLRESTAEVERLKAEVERLIQTSNVVADRAKRLLDAVETAHDALCECENLEPSAEEVRVTLGKIWESER
jgi:archaellum component FlaC